MDKPLKHLGDKKTEIFEEQIAKSLWVETSDNEEECNFDMPMSEFLEVLRQNWEEELLKEIMEHELFEPDEDEGVSAMTVILKLDWEVKDDMWGEEKKEFELKEADNLVASVLKDIMSTN